MATRFDTSAEVSDHVLANGNQDHVTWDQMTKVSGGGSLHFDVLDADGADSGNWWDYLATDHRVFGNGDEYYVQYRYRVTEALWRYMGYTSIKFDAGSTAFTAGETITGGTSGGTATVRTVVLESGSWAGGDAVGHLVLENGYSTSFVENESLSGSSGGSATSSVFGDLGRVLEGSGGHKISIFSYHTGSNQNNEVVTQNSLYRAFFQSYHQDGSSFVNNDEGRSTPCNAGNFALQNAIDTGSPASPTTCAEYANRYGPLYDYGSGTNAPVAGDVVAQGHPRAEATSSGVAIPSLTWVTVYSHVTIGTLGTASSRIEQWIALPGEGYVKIIDVSGVTLGTGNGGHDAIWLLPYDSGKQSYAKEHAAEVWYDELLVSTQPIAAPQ